LPPGRDRRAAFELAELLPRLTGSQVQEIGKLSPTLRLLLVVGRRLMYRANWVRQLMRLPEGRRVGLRAKRVIKPM
jgi:hypothetical protein